MTRRRIRPLLPPAFAALIANGLPPATPATEEELLLLDVCALISTRIAEQNRVIEKLDAEVAQRAPLADLTPIQARAFNRARRRLANAFAKLDRLVRAQALILQIIDERHPPRKDHAP